MVAGYDVLVVGAGIAGISLAARLAERRRKVAILEAEWTAPLHATGRAAAFRDPIDVPNADVAALAMAGAAKLERIAGAVEPRTAVHLFREDQLADYAGAIARCHALSVPIEEMLPDRITAAYPFLSAGGPNCAVGLRLPPGAAAAIDGRAVYGHFRRRFQGAGGTIIVEEPLESGRYEGGGWTVTTPRRTLRTPIVANCAGAWSDMVAARCGLTPLGLVSLRRTAVITPLERRSGPAVQIGLTVFWGRGDACDLYCDFRPDARVMLSPADEQVVQPCDARAEAMDIGIAIQRFHERTRLRVMNAGARNWAVLRTVGADRRPAIGWSREAPSFFWSTAYGGFGVECAPSASAVAADLMLGEARFRQAAADHGIRTEPFAPDRLQPVPAGRD